MADSIDIREIAYTKAEIDEFFNSREQPGTNFSIDRTFSSIRDVLYGFTLPPSTGNAQIYFDRVYGSDEAGIEVSGYVTGDIDFSLHRVDVYSTTDIDYLQGSSAIGDDGAWSVSGVGAGTKTAKLVLIADESVVAEAFNTTGLVRSYAVPTDDVNYDYLYDKCFVYDQALAVVTMCILDQADYADYIVSGLVTAIQNNGGLVCFSVNYKTGIADDLYVRNGATAWALYALAFYAKTYGTGNADVMAAIDSVATQLLSYQVSSSGMQNGAISGGSGQYSSDYLTFDDTYQAPWCSTEHNIDSYFALKLAGEVAESDTYISAAETVKNALLTNFWSDDLGRFYQGITDDTTADGADALDCHTWGSMFLRAVGETQKQATALDELDLFAFGIGYTPYVEDRGYAGVTPGLWGEGTLGAILAKRETGDISWIDNFKNLLEAFSATSGLKYTTVRDEVYELESWYSVAATAWIVLAMHPEGFWEMTKSGTINEYYQQQIDERTTAVEDRVVVLEENIITTPVMKTVASATSADPSAFDFSTLHDALRWVEKKQIFNAGTIALGLDDGMHYLGRQGPGEIDAASGSYYNFSNTNIALLSMSMSGNCVLTMDPYDDGDAGPKIISAFNSILQFVGLVINEDAGGYLYPLQVAFVTCYKTTVSVSMAMINGFYEAFSLDAGSQLKASQLTIENIDGAIRARNRSSIAATGMTIDGASSLIYGPILVDNSDIYISSGEIKNSLYGVYTQQGGKAVLESVTLTNNTNDANIPLNEIQYNGAYVSTANAPLTLKA